jgi:DNA-binding response OmpR family regulator
MRCRYVSAAAPLTCWPVTSVTYNNAWRAIYGERRGNDRERIFARMRHIRRRIEDDPAHGRRLIAVRGEGFRLAN